MRDIHVFIRVCSIVLFLFASQAYSQATPQACRDACNRFSDFDECPWVCPPRESLNARIPDDYPDGTYMTLTCTNVEGARCIDPIPVGQIDSDEEWNDLLMAERAVYGYDVYKFYACERKLGAGYQFAGFGTAYVDFQRREQYGCNAGLVCCIPRPWCDDKEGMDIYRKKICKDSYGTVSADKCIIGNKFLLEQSCMSLFREDGCWGSLKVCPDGFECKDGACVEKVLEPACSEGADEGRDKYEGGTCIDNEGYRDGKRKYSRSFIEVCAGANSVFESYCEDSKCKWEEIVCPEGYFCEGDRCIEVPVPDLCEDEDGLDYYKGNTCRDNSGKDHGWKEMPDRCHAVAEGLLIETACNEKNRCEWNYYSCPSGSCTIDACDDCNDPDGADVMSKGVCRDFNGGDPLEDVCDESDKSFVREAVCNSMARQECTLMEIDCPEGHECSEGKCVPKAPAPPVKSCLNSGDEGSAVDGFDETDRHTKGVCWQNKDKDGNIFGDMVVSKEDFCTNETSSLLVKELLDYYCDPGLGECVWKIVTCEDFGEVCKDGVCVPKEEPEGKCINTGDEGSADDGFDERDPFKHGTCVSNKNQGGVIVSEEPSREFPDSCSNVATQENYLIDYYCNRETGMCSVKEPDEINCEDYGMICLEGKCQCPEDPLRDEKGNPSCIGNVAYPDCLVIDETTYIREGERCTSETETTKIEGDGTDCTPLKKICMRARCVTCESLGMDDYCGEDGKTLYSNYHFSEEAASELSGRTEIDVRDYCRYDVTECEYGCDPVKKECKREPVEPGEEEDSKANMWRVTYCSPGCKSRGPCWDMADQPDDESEFYYSGTEPCTSGTIQTVCEQENLLGANGCTMDVEYLGTNADGRPRETTCDCGSVAEEPEPENSCTNSDLGCGGGEEYCSGSVTYTDAGGSHEMADVCDYLRPGAGNFGEPTAYLTETSCVGERYLEKSVDCSARVGYLCWQGECVKDCRICGGGLLDFDTCDKDECTLGEGRSHCEFTPSLLGDSVGSCGFA